MTTPDQPDVVGAALAAAPAFGHPDGLPADPLTAIEDPPVAPGSTRYPLPTDGAWVDLRDYRAVRGRDRKAAMQAMMAAVSLDENGKVRGMTTALAVVAQMNTAECVAALLTTAWNIPYMPDAPLPQEDAELIPDLFAPDYDELLRLVAPGVAALMPKRVTVDDAADPNSPSGPSSG